MCKTNQVKHVEVKQMCHNLMTNECRWKTPRDKKRVRMVRVVVVYFTDSEGKKTDTVSMECCAEHQENAVDALIGRHGLRH